MRGADIVVHDTITTVGGAINLAAFEDVMFSADGDVTSTSGAVSVANPPGVNPWSDFVGGAITMADGTEINAGSGRIILWAQFDVTLGLVTTTSSATALPEAVSISCLSGQRD